jgi:transcriptional antiterminator RfaH
MGTIADARWHVVQTQPHAEARAASHLLRQGYSVYLPRYLKQRRHARRVETVAAPLFPRYLFVAVQGTAGRWRSIQSTVGVSRLICNGDDPAVVAEAIIEELRGREDPQGFIRVRPSPSFIRGDKVRVLEGVFSASLGLFDGMADRERVAVLLDLLGRKVRVVMGAEIIAAA